jgi:hypothetical protein
MRGAPGKPTKDEAGLGLTMNFVLLMFMLQKGLRLGYRRKSMRDTHNVINKTSKTAELSL